MTSYSSIYGFCFKILIIFCLSFYYLGILNTLATSTWEKVVIERVLANDLYLLEDGRKITLLKIEIPEVIASKKNLKTGCTRKIRRFLKEKLTRKKVLIKIVDLDKKRLKKTIFRSNKIFSVYLKFKTGNDFFSLDLLRLGFGKLKNKNLSYFKNSLIEAENLARFKKNGLWGNCKKLNFANYQIQFAKKDILKERYGTYLNNISVGVVKEVFSGNSFVLENGLKVKLLGVESPLENDPRASFACFGKLAKQKLAEKILGKRVFLEKDNAQLSKYRELFRYVKIPKTKKTREIFINQEMIKEGFGRSFFDKFNKFYQNDFNKIQQNIYRNPPIGAWKKCLKMFK